MFYNQGIVTSDSLPINVVTLSIFMIKLTTKVNAKQIKDFLAIFSISLLLLLGKVLVLLM